MNWFRHVAKVRVASSNLVIRSKKPLVKHHETVRTGGCCVWTGPLSKVGQSKVGSPPQTAAKRLTRFGKSWRRCAESYAHSNDRRAASEPGMSDCCRKEVLRDCSSTRACDRLQSFARICRPLGRSTTTPTVTCGCGHRAALQASRARSVGRQRPERSTSCATLPAQDAALLRRQTDGF